MWEREEEPDLPSRHTSAPSLDTSVLLGFLKIAKTYLLQPGSAPLPHV